MNSQQASESAGRDLEEKSMADAAHFSSSESHLTRILFDFDTRHRRAHDTVTQNFFALSGRSRSDGLE
jgi:hemerythrin